MLYNFSNFFFSILLFLFRIVPENFDYIAKDVWKPYNQLTDGFLTQKIKETENSQFEKVSNEANFER